ncbi:MAG: AMP-binding protein [Firmicutes bacterium]|nr:AMP-binding protein [Bacillota bacterium]
MSEKYHEKYHDVREVRDIRHMLDESTSMYADRPAYLVKKAKGEPYGEILFRQVENDVKALATAMLDLGLSGEKIAVIGANCYEWIATYFAVVNAVGVIVPLDKELSKEEIDTLMEISQCKAVFFTDKYEKYFKEYTDMIKVKMKVYGDRTSLEDKLTCTEPAEGESWLWESLVARGEELREKGDRSYEEAPLDPDEMRLLLFTSGTTEAAKGVMLSHRNIVSDVMATCKIAYITPEDRTLSFLPIHHTFECTLGHVLVMYRGASVAYCEGLKYVTKNLAEAKSTVLIGVPLIFESVYDKVWKQAEKTGKAKILRTGIKVNRTAKALGIDLHKKLFKTVYDTFGGRLNRMITGAAAIEPNVSRGFQDMGFMVQQGYGLTECSPLVAGSPDFSPQRYAKAGSVGPVIPGGELKIDDPDEDGIGEILYRGPNVMLGYYNMPEKTAEVLDEDGWFHTGDLGFLDREGWLYITGRRKNVIVTKTGKNIYPEEMEMYINRSKYVEESMVYGVEEEDDTYIGAQVRPAYDVIFEEFGKDYSEENIQKLIKKAIAEINVQLPSYKRVKRFVVRSEEFVKTTTKKIKRFKNMDDASAKDMSALDDDK